MNLTRRGRGFLLFFLLLAPVVGPFGFQGVNSFTIYNRYADGNSENATGIVVDDSERTFGARYTGDIYYPRIQYVTKAGNKVTARDDYGTEYIARGQSVDILYRRDDTAHVILAYNRDGAKSSYELARVIVIVYPLILLFLFFVLHFFA